MVSPRQSAISKLYHTFCHLFANIRSIYISLGCLYKKVYNAFKYVWGNIVPNFPEHQLGYYKIRLRPNDRLRRFVSQYIVDLIEYTDTSVIDFDLRIAMPKNGKIDDNISYKWTLCDKNDNPLSSIINNKFCPYNTQGCGNAHITNIKEKDVSYYVADKVIMKKYFRTINIGALSRSDNYKIFMVFNNNSINILMAQFKVYDKADLIYKILGFVIGGGFIWVIVDLIFRHFGW